MRFTTAMDRRLLELISERHRDVIEDARSASIQQWRQLVMHQVFVDKLTLHYCLV